MSNLLIPNAKEEVLAVGIKTLKDRLDELAQGLESRSLTPEALQQGFRAIERSLRQLRRVA